MKSITYFRVSTAAQGRSGLGLDAQRAAVATFCKTRGSEVLGEYVEVESGKRDDRPQLAAALRHAKLTGATLVIAKLDRLSRNVAFLASLQDSGVRFIAADMPEANELTVHIMAAVAQAERKAIATRTREALKAAKARGVKLGNPNGAAALRRAGKGTEAAIEAVRADADAFAASLAETIAGLRSAGITSLPGLSKALNDARIRTPRGGQWHPSSVRNVLKRLEL
ncbi:MAG: recombinase family protein [Alphaproteobacteria bacterium]|nr:recombinase family protein [Alphaproteobacteria bacterium]